MTITPNSMPKKSVSKIHELLLAKMIETRPFSWVHKVIDPESPEDRKPNVLKTKVAGYELASPLAQNISTLNVELAAKRWVS